MTEQPAIPQEPTLVRPMPRLAEARQRLGIAPGAGARTPSLGETGSSLGDPDYAEFERTLQDAVERANRSTEVGNLDRQMQGLPPLPLLPMPWRTPPAVELCAMADDLNAHGGPDETFVAGLLQAAAGGREGGDAPRPRWRRALDRARRWGR